MTSVTVALLVLVLAILVGLGVAALDSSDDYGLIEPVEYRKGEPHD